jgi:hypothetical protein
MSILCARCVCQQPAGCERLWCSVLYLFLPFLEASQKFHQHKLSWAALSHTAADVYHCCCISLCCCAWVVLCTCQTQAITAGL